MRLTIAWAVFALFTSPALGDDRALISRQMQEMSDAVATGNAAVWDKYLDASVIFAEEDDSWKDKAGMLKEIRPLPKGLGGTIRIELLSWREDGDVAVALFRQNETERYFGQTIHARYLTNTTWRKRVGGWKLIAAQVLAEKTDPPSIALSASELAQYLGAYRLKDSEPITTLTLKDGKLSGVRNGRKPAIWNAEVRDVFVIAGDPRIRKIFTRDESGRITGFVERRESWDIDWIRIK